MPDTIVCRVVKPNGKFKKYRCRDGKPFADKKGNRYNPPIKDKHEILEFKSFWGGDKRWSFYREGEENAVPLNRDVQWRQSTNNDKDKDILVAVTAEALLETGGHRTRSVIAIAGIGLLVLLQLLEFAFN